MDISNHCILKQTITGAWRPHLASSIS